MKTLLLSTALVLATVSGAFAWDSNSTVSEIQVEIDGHYDVRDARPSGKPQWNTPEWQSYAAIRREFQDSVGLSTGGGSMRFIRHAENRIATLEAEAAEAAQAAADAAEAAAMTAGLSTMGLNCLTVGAHAAAALEDFSTSMESMQYILDLQDSCS